MFKATGRGETPTGEGRKRRDKLLGRQWTGQWETGNYGLDGCEASVAFSVLTQSVWGGGVVLFF